MERDHRHPRRARRGRPAEGASPAGRSWSSRVPKLVQTLTAEGLVDEYQLWIHPVVVGGVGKRLFEDGNPLTKLRLVDSRTTATGLVILTYARA